MSHRAQAKGLEMGSKAGAGRSVANHRQRGGGRGQQCDQSQTAWGGSEQQRDQSQTAWWESGQQCDQSQTARWGSGAAVWPVIDSVGRVWERVCCGVCQHPVD